MHKQHIINEDRDQREGILVPLDLPEFRIQRQQWQADGTITVEVMAIAFHAMCPHCQKMSMKIHDTRARRKRDSPLRHQKVELIVLKRRFWCVDCRKAFTEQDTACGWRRRTTRRLRQEIGKQASTQPISHVAERYDVGPRFVQTCLTHVARREIEQRGLSLDEQQSLPTPRLLGIDEFARRKGHRYDTILCDLVNRRVLEVSAGRTLEEVQKLLGRLRHPEVVEAVSMDMSASFRPAVQNCLPHAQIVVDHFHVIQHVMKAFRKIVSSWAHKKEGMILLHKKQHLFLRAKEDLSEEEAQERRKIGHRLPMLEAAWLLKEELRGWYATATVETAAEGLETWMQHVQTSPFDHLKKALSAFVKWRKEILAFFQFRISNGFVEGKNNRTKMIMRQGYGFTNRQHLRLRILVGNGG
jgi:transposase